MSVGFIGLGAMGEGMAKNLARSGLLSGVFNRTTDKAKVLAEALRVTFYEQIETLAADMDVIVMCVAADADVIDVITVIQQTVKPGTVVIDSSTVSSDTAIKASQLLATKQAKFLDAPVSGGVEGATNGTLAMMIGGDEALIEQVRPVLEAMTARNIHIGQTGSGQAAKAVNQVMCAGINQAVTEALRFGEAQSLPMERVIDAVSGGAAGNWFLSHRGVSMLKREYPPGFKLKLHHKDLKICQTMANNAHVHTPLVDKTIKEYDQLLASGHGDEDISVLYSVLNDD